MAIDDIEVMWQRLPEVFEPMGIPASWEDEWSFGVGEPNPAVGLTRTPRTWLDYIVFDGPADSEAELGSAEPRWSGPTLLDDSGFGGAPVSRDASQEVPPPDALGFYLPFHYFYPDWWGIYIIAEGVQELATWLRNEGGGELFWPTAVGLAYQFIYRHESFHHAVEAFASRLEVTHRIPVFRTSVREVRKRQMPPDVTDEALASGYAIQHCSDWLLKSHPHERAIGERTIRAYIQLQPPPYDSALEFDVRSALVDGRDHLAEEIQREARPDLPSLPSELWSMFGHAFTGFAKIDSRVHYVVRRDSELHQRMAGDDFLLRYRDLAKKLRRSGCSEAREGQGSHVIWVGPSGANVPVPKHGGRDLAPGTLRKILRQLGIDDSLARFAAS